jgi:hypothetical protein
MCGNAYEDLKLIYKVRGKGILAKQQPNPATSIQF